MCFLDPERLATRSFCIWRSDHEPSQTHVFLDLERLTTRSFCIRRSDQEAPETQDFLDPLTAQTWSCSACADDIVAAQSVADAMHVNNNGLAAFRARGRHCGRVVCGQSRVGKGWRSGRISATRRGTISVLAGVVLCLPKD